MKTTVQCPSFMILCFSPTTHGKCNGHWTKNFNGHGTVNSEQWTLATWRRVPASGIMSKPSQKLTPWLCMLWLLSNLLQSWQQGLIFQSEFCLSLSTVAIWHGRKTFTSQCQEVTRKHVNSERTDLSLFIKPNHPAYSQSLACHGLPPTSLSNSRPLESRQRSSRLCSWLTRWSQTCQPFGDIACWFHLLVLKGLRTKFSPQFSPYFSPHSPQS